MFVFKPTIKTYTDPESATFLPGIPFGRLYSKGDICLLHDELSGSKIILNSKVLRQALLDSKDVIEDMLGIIITDATSTEEPIVEEPTADAEEPVTEEVPDEPVVEEEPAVEEAAKEVVDEPVVEEEPAVEEAAKEVVEELTDTTVEDLTIEDEKIQKTSKKSKK